MPEEPGDANWGDTANLTESYEMLWHLWSSGTGQYHQLVSTYLTALSILMVTTALVLSAAVQTPPLAILTTLLCIAGMFMCLQMHIAAGRFTAQNAYWERCLREIEAHDGTARLPYFREWWRHRERQWPVPWHPSNNPDKEKPFAPNDAVKLHRRPWTTRMRLIPRVFGVLYGCFFVTSLVVGFSLCWSVRALGRCVHLP